jgi:signal transduction histidine kinase/ligand-binding sensor domain-containing protein/CheY-like chemotaxis protein
MLIHFAVLPFHAWGPDENYNLRFFHITSEDGLSNDSVTCMMQDKTGFIWIGTIYGLNRYDGYNFKIYKYNPALGDKSLSDNWIKSIFQDRHGFIWVGTANGLDRLDPDTDKIKQYESGLGNSPGMMGDQVTAIHEDSNGGLWFGTTAGLHKYDREKDAIVYYPMNMTDTRSIGGSIGSSWCKFIYEDKAGILWIGNDKNIYAFDRGKDIFIPAGEIHPPLQKYEAFKFRRIRQDGHGNFWIATNGGGLIKYNPGNKQAVLYTYSARDSHSISDDYIRIIYESPSGELWFGASTGGLNRYDEKNDRFIRYVFEANRGRPANVNLDSIFEDRYGVLWAGIYGRGVTKIVRIKKIFKAWVKELNNPDTLSSSSVLAIYEDHLGVLWVGTDRGLNRYDSADNRFVHYVHHPSKPGTLSDNTVRSIGEDKLGRLWVATHAGLNRFDRQKQTFTHYTHDPANPRSLSTSQVKKIYKDRSGTLWIGTWKGLDRYSYDTGDFTRFPADPADPHSLSHGNVFTILEDREGTLWVGTRAGGLNRFDKKRSRFTRFVSDPKNPRGISHSYVMSLCEDKDGRFWVGTKDGLNLMDRQTGIFTRYYEKDGLPNSIIYGILEDREGNLWISTNCGLCKFHPSRGVLKNYFAASGLQNNEFNGDVCFKSKSGKLYFGGILGFNAFYPEEIEEGTIIPPVVMVSRRFFRERERKVYPPLNEKSIKLPFRENLFSMEFAVLDYRAPKNNRYAYMLEGLDTGWHYTGNRNFATFSNLEPGKYRLLVKGADSAAIWNKEGTSLDIEIIAPLWKTAWFKVLIVLLIASGVFFLVRLRLREIKNREKRLQTLVAERTRELEEERKTAMEANRSKGEFLARMSHEIRTPMNSVIGFTEMLMDTDLNPEQRDFTRTINQSGEVLLTLIDEILDFSRIEAGELTLDEVDFDPEDTAFGVCELILPRLADKSVEVLCRAYDNVPAYVTGDPGRFRQVLLNLVGNAVKFTEEGQIEVTLGLKEERENRVKLQVNVRDTGIGIPGDKLHAIFEVFQQADGSVTRKYGGSGLGLTISKQIARLMGGDLTVESTPGQGSVFHFTTWLSRSRESPPEPIVPEGLSNRKILVVDDNRNNLDILSHVLGKAGLRVTTLEAAEKAVPLLLESLKKGDSFELCIIDIRMSGMSGYDLAREIRGAPAPICDLPLLAYSSSIANQMKKCADAGFDVFLPKPARRLKLLETVGQLLEETAGAGVPLNMMNAPEDTLVFESLAKLTGGDKDTEPGLIATLGPEADSGPEPEPARILLVEDNTINRKLAGFMLARAGYRFDNAENGREAVAKFAAEPHAFDLILMDIQMPEMDGYQATRQIRKIEAGLEIHLHHSSSMNYVSHIPIIAMTAQTMEGDREACLMAGMDDYISKPIKREKIIGMVEKWLSDPAGKS